MRKHYNGECFSPFGDYWIANGESDRKGVAMNSTQSQAAGEAAQVSLALYRSNNPKGYQIAIEQNGGGYRLAGPDFNGQSVELQRQVISERDAAEIRAFLERRFPIIPGIVANAHAQLTADLQAAQGEIAALRDGLKETSNQLSALVGISQQRIATKPSIMRAIGNARTLLAGQPVQDPVKEELVAALKEIARGEGPFSLDPLTHASNTIEAMKTIARAALAQAKGGAS